jgi:tRNA uridine 5-carbamoylmethylation protein Kti12
MSDTIKNTRTMIAELGGSELKAVAGNASLQKLFKQKQELISEMNKAKREASDSAARPYLEAIDDIDNTYSFLLTFIGNNKSKE